MQVQESDTTMTQKEQLPVPEKEEVICEAIGEIIFEVSSCKCKTFFPQITQIPQIWRR